MTTNHHRNINSIALVFLVIYWIFRVKFFFILALLMLLISVLSDGLTLKISKTWTKFAALLGAINSKILLSLVFYLVLTPIALLYRHFSKKPPSKSQTNFSAYPLKPFNNEFFKKLW
jgi:hypothetical protein